MPFIIINKLRTLRKVEKQFKLEIEHIRYYGNSVAEQTCNTSSEIFKLGKEIDKLCGCIIDARQNSFEWKRWPVCKSNPHR